MELLKKSSIILLFKCQGPKNIVPKVQYKNGSNISITLKMILHFPSLLGVIFIDKTPNKIPIGQIKGVNIKGIPSNL